MTEVMCSNPEQPVKPEQPLQAHDTILFGERPSSSAECAFRSQKPFMLAGNSGSDDDGTIVHPTVHRECIGKQSALAAAEEKLVAFDSDVPSASKRLTTRSVKALRPFCIDKKTGIVHCLKPKASSWHVLCIANPDAG